MIDNAFFKAIRRIEIQTKHLAENLLSGAYLSAFKGSGIEFEEVKEYHPGDDVRAIDWNVTARMGHPYLKSFREERELTVLLMVDRSSSLRFGVANRKKSSLIAEVAALLTFSAMRNGDKVGLLQFSKGVDSYLAPKRGSRHALRIIRELMLEPPLYRTTDLAAALAFVGKVLHRRAVCFLLSDFICPDFSHELSIIAKKHDLIAIKVSDPFEISLPNINLALLSDLETGEKTLIDTSYAPLRQSFEHHSAAQQSAMKKLLAKTSGGYIELSTNKPYLPAIKRFFKQRGQQRR